MIALLNRLLVASFACLAAASALAQSSFPIGPVRLVVPFAAGGPGDLVARIVAERVAADLGQAVVVENRTGANGAIGVQAVTRAKPDGYTLLQMSAANVIVPLLQENLYDWERELVPLFGLGAVPYAFAVNAKSGIRSFADLVATAKSTPGGLNYASGGAGSPSHLAPARLAGELKVSATHVPFRGLSGAVQALLGNQVHFICATTVDVIPLARSGDVRLLAVTAETRLPELADTPTTAELGLADFQPATWYGYFAPAGTPVAVVERLNAAFARAAGEPAIGERLGKLGLTIKPRTGGELAAYARDDAARWRRVIQEHRIRIEN